MIARKACSHTFGTENCSVFSFNMLYSSQRVWMENANYPMIYNWGSIETFFQFKFKTIMCNLRDSLVPATAVIPALKKYYCYIRNILLIKIIVCSYLYEGMVGVNCNIKLEVEFNDLCNAYDCDSD